MDKGKYQPWYHESFMSDPRVRRMSPLAAKTYMLLLHEAFVCSTRPNLPDDEDELEMLGWCSSEEWQLVREPILKMFSREEVDGRPVLTNKRLTKDWEHLQEIREARSEAGKAGAEKRWGSKSKPEIANDTESMAKNSKEVSKYVSNKSKVSEEEETDMKLRDELTKIATFHGAKAGGYKTTWDEIKSLGIAHGTGAVATDFSAYMEEYHGDDFPSGAVVSYLRTAAERLVAGSEPSTLASKDPSVVNLIRELTYLSGDKVTFQGRHKVQLSELLRSWSSEELVSVFKTFLSDKDLEDPYVLKYITGNFLDAADGLSYSAKKRKQESEQTKLLRDSTARRLQEEAEAERANKPVEPDFDPLA